ncbi:MAG: hypothetical protein K0S07_241 [Chlamydiales bacterium]|jgi:hypothetical protein|nr:hypothetical protein [Chlamydiales bacterium]
MQPHPFFSFANRSQLATDSRENFDPIEGEELMLHLLNSIKKKPLDTQRILTLWSRTKPNPSHPAMQKALLRSYLLLMDAIHMESVHDMRLIERFKKICPSFDESWQKGFIELLLEKGSFKEVLIQIRYVVGEDRLWHQAPPLLCCEKEVRREMGKLPKPCLLTRDRPKVSFLECVGAKEQADFTTLKERFLSRFQREELNPLFSCLLHLLYKAEDPMTGFAALEILAGFSAPPLEAFSHVLQKGLKNRYYGLEQRVALLEGLLSCAKEGSMAIKLFSHFFEHLFQNEIGSFYRDFPVSVLIGITSLFEEHLLPLRKDHASAYQKLAAIYARLALEPLDFNQIHLDFALWPINSPHQLADGYLELVTYFSNQADYFRGRLSLGDIKSKLMRQALRSFASKARELAKKPLRALNDPSTLVKEQVVLTALLFAQNVLQQDADSLISLEVNTTLRGLDSIDLNGSTLSRASTYTCFHLLRGKWIISSSTPQALAFFMQKMPAQLKYKPLSERSLQILRE